MNALATLRDDVAGYELAGTDRKGARTRARPAAVGRGPSARACVPGLRERSRSAPWARVGPSLQGCSSRLHNHPHRARSTLGWFRCTRTTALRSPSHSTAIRAHWSTMPRHIHLCCRQLHCNPSASRSNSESHRAPPWRPIVARRSDTAPDCYHPGTRASCSQRRSPAPEARPLRPAGDRSRRLPRSATTRARRLLRHNPQPS